MAKRKKKAREPAVANAAAEAPEAKADASPGNGPGSFLSGRNGIYVVAAIAIVVIAALVFMMMNVPGGGLTGGVVMASEDVGAKTVDFLQSRLELSYPGIEMEVVSVTDYEDIPGIYEVIIKITFQGQSQDIPYYVTKDGNYMFANVVDLNEELPEDVAAGEQPAQEEEGVPKSDRPKVDLFIMSYCPYGLQMQKAFLPVMELLGDKADMKVKWVSYIMHGKEEIDENTRQYCIQLDQPEKYISYASCFTESGEVDACLASAGIDTAMLDSCMENADEDFNITGLYEDESTWSNGRYPPYMIDAQENVLFGVRGSPTLVINGKVVSASRSPEAIKQAVCEAFNVAPAECSQPLQEEQASPGFGGGVYTSSGAEGSCG